MPRADGPLPRRPATGILSHNADRSARWARRQAETAAKGDPIESEYAPCTPGASVFVHCLNGAAVKAEYINPFLDALVNAFDMMLGCAVRRGPLALSSKNLATHDYSGVIGLSGQAVGTVVVSLSTAVARKATAVMLMTPEDEVTREEIVDAVGELANMVAGAAKAKLEEYDLSVSLPSVITGEGHEICFPSNVTPICVPYQSDWGPLTLEVGMAMVPVPV